MAISAGAAPLARLRGKVALVTGAGAGIGEAMCQRFTAEGAVVVALDRSADSLKRVAASIPAGGGALHTIAADVTREADCRRAVAEAQDRHGTLHALCNVAGVVDMGRLIDAPEESWQRSFDVNLKGMWHLCRLVVPILVAGGGGSIVNIASVAGLFAVKERGVYSTTKAGVVGMTKSLAMDHIGEGIRANAICPGTVDSPSLHDRINQAADPKRALAEFIGRQPMGRLGRADEIAALAAYLISDESAYMTGQALVIDGGMTM